jgi:GNAT superfamily N-acetyltransferase
VGDPVLIRPATLDDAPALAPLLAELGYPLTEELMRENLVRLGDAPTDRAWVAERDGAVIGVVSAHLTPLFHQRGYLGRITALVVTAAARGQGIGGRLVRQAEAFCWQAGCARMELTSGDHRTDAHRFYEGLGWRAESRRFIKRRPQD